MRLIDADKFRADVLSWENCYNGFSDTYDKARIIDAIDEQPTIAAEPNSCKYWDSESHFCALRRPQAESVRRGRWIREPNCWYRCEVCGEHYPSIADNMKYNYCPNCGALMEEQE